MSSFSTIIGPSMIPQPASVAATSALASLMRTRPVGSRACFLPSRAKCQVFAGECEVEA